MTNGRFRLQIEHCGPIRRADVSFADLTVLVGPQATGKSLFLQMLKLVLDHASVTATLRSYGLDWNESARGFLDAYLGRGMSSVWSTRKDAKSWIHWQEKPVHLDAIAAERQPGVRREQCFVIPAQRVLAFSSQSWIRPFSDFRAGDPYVIRAFSERLRVQADAFFDSGTRVWRLDDDAYALVQESIFGRFDLAVQNTGSQKELVLTGARPKKPLPFMVWSAGQREFVPLMLALTWLLPSGGASVPPAPEWVLIEEPEMGLHPKAVKAVLYLVLKLLERGYRVCLSTHSTHVLDLIWAMQVFRGTRAPLQALPSLFDVDPDGPAKKMASSVMKKRSAVYFFDDDSHETRDISGLDPGDADPDVSSWGKLTEFTNRVGETIAREVARRI